MDRLAAPKILVAAALAATTFTATLGFSAVEARPRRGDTAPLETAGVPNLNVKGSCADAQKFSTGDDKKLAYNGCLQDELNAKSELGKRWSEFKGRDRSTCVEQARYPSPSYVEVLTCLEMSSGSFKGGARFNGGPAATPQVGGQVAPGLSKPVDGETPAK